MKICFIINIYTRGKYLFKHHGEKKSRPSRELKKRMDGITDLHYYLVDQELQCEYKIEFGIDPCDPQTYRYFTHEEQTERYAKNMLFWIKHKPNIEFDDFMKTDTKTIANVFYVSNKTLELQRKISTLLPSLQKSIHERLNELLRI